MEDARFINETKETEKKAQRMKKENKRGDSYFVTQR